MNGSARHIAKRVEALKEMAAAERESVERRHGRGSPHAVLALIVRDLAAEVELLAKLLREQQT